MAHDVEHVLHLKPRGVVADVRGVAVSYWRQPFDAAAVDALRTWLTGMSARYPARIGSLMVFRAGSMDARAFAHGPTRAAIEALSRETAPLILARAVVVEGSGLAVAALRMAAMSVHLLTHARYPTRVFDRVAEAAPWLVASLPPGKGYADEAALLRGVAALQREVDAPDWAR